ncbi:MAG: hypothetical protein LBE92_10735 [Chryseobacterium sp.]|jgi:hypothetical protein|uniref:LA_2272 family surface repeat-containing protein n=1 Tax=Chryseobacterium sp. TaxID=1871047 RepID=UPI00281BDD6F|nr:hypothetical protein [Chryseobacterium sp.]MDR2236591.1 hypothetical protein [Chryseobacterium sp.]
MKIILLITGLLLSSLASAQDSLSRERTSFAALTPLNKIDKVNGIALGLGGVLDKNRTRKINGINLEPVPLGPFVWMFYDPAKNRKDKAELIVNGLTVSGCGYGSIVNHNGVAVSVYNYGNTMNGMIITGLGTYIDKGSGMMVSGFYNYGKELKGLNIAPVNHAEIFKGSQIGVYNKAQEMKGLQIGLVNVSRKMKGLQLGIWNKNGKRSLPVINF